jgi:hypothetical protein
MDSAICRGDVIEISSSLPLLPPIGVGAAPICLAIPEELAG